jgi:hypothetical protein
LPETVALATGPGVSAGVVARNRRCGRSSVNPRTFYRHRARIAAEGVWRERSRRPRCSPAATPAELERWICKLRAELAPDNGADYLRDALIQLHAQTGPAWSVRARSTINRMLDPAGGLGV